MSGGFNPYRDRNGEFADPATSGKPGRSRAGAAGQNWQGGKTRVAKAAPVAPASGKPRVAYGATTSGDRRFQQAPSQAVYKQASAALTPFRRVDGKKNVTDAGWAKGEAARTTAAKILRRTRGAQAQRLASDLTSQGSFSARIDARAAAKTVAGQARRKKPKA
jgi:hypothetical protein